MTDKDETVAQPLATNAGPSQEGSVSAAAAASRAAFEKWLLDYQGLTAEWEPKRNCYSQLAIHVAWKAWQASQRAGAPAATIEDATSANGVPDTSLVICPACTHQFSAISVDDQRDRNRLLRDLKAQEDENTVTVSSGIFYMKEKEAAERELSKLRAELDAVWKELPAEPDADRLHELADSMCEDGLEQTASHLHQVAMELHILRRSAIALLAAKNTEIAEMTQAAENSLQSWLLAEQDYQKEIAAENENLRNPPTDEEIHAAIAIVAARFEAKEGKC